MSSSTHTQTPADVPRLLTIGDVCDLVRLSRSSVYKAIAAGDFPQGYRIAGRSVRWFYHDVIAHLNKIKSQTDALRGNAAPTSSAKTG